jgi:hypothetical protein
MLSSKGLEMKEQSHISATTHELPLSYICCLLDTILEQLPFHAGISMQSLAATKSYRALKMLIKNSFHMFPITLELLSDLW